jgi:hypothetical protein
MKKQLFFALAAGVLASASIHAEEVYAKIPFDFQVGKSILPAGTYGFEKLGVPNVLRIRSEDWKKSVMVIANPTMTLQKNLRPRIVFNRYDSHYFLWKVWGPNPTFGAEVIKSPREKEMALTIPVERQTLLATAR